MTINTWSVIVFGVTAFHFVMIFISVFGLPTVGKFVMLFISWLAMVITTFIYGMSTNQIGFVLMALMELLSVVAVFIITERMFSNEDS